jgi:hypothetical protein
MPDSIYEMLQTIPDPRSPSGKRYSLASILAIILAATLSGRTSLRSIARWAKGLSQKQLLALGITRGRAPGQSTMHNLLCLLPPEEVEKALGQWTAAVVAEKPGRQIAIDGKTLRASAESDYPALHLLAAYCPQHHGVLAQQAVAAKENEITAAKEMLESLPVKGAVVTGDAMFCQRELCQTIVDKGGDFLFTAKDNQPALVENIATAFSPSFSPVRAPRPGKPGVPPRNPRPKARSPGTAAS